MRKTLQEKIDEEVATRMAKGLGTVNPYEVVRKLKNGSVKIGDEVLTDKEVEILKADIITIKQLRLWKILQETTKQYAIDWSLSGTALNNKDEELLRHLSGKMWLHCLGTQQEIIRIIEKLT